MNIFKELKLTKLQNKHLDSTRWLINGPKRTGRSLLMAGCFIEKALQYPGETISVFDHFPHPFGRNEIISQIKMILSGNSELRECFTIGLDWIRA